MIHTEHLLSRPQLLDLAKVQLKTSLMPKLTTDIKLSARVPCFEDVVSIEVRSAFSWDSTQDIIALTPRMISPGTNLPQSNMTITFNPRADDRYVLVVHFFGRNVTMNIRHNYAGISSCSAGNNIDPNAVLTIIDGKIGVGDSFYISCSAPDGQFTTGNIPLIEIFN